MSSPLVPIAGGCIIGVIIAGVMLFVSALSEPPSQKLDEVRLCSIKAQEFQKAYVMREGKCYLEVE